MTQYFFYFDQTRCMGCDTCTVQCKDFNNINPGAVRWRAAHSVEEGIFPKTKFFNVVYSCNHCENPACIPSCGRAAIYKDEDTGAVIIDRDKCVNLKDCISACPYGAISIANSKQETKAETWQVMHPAQKCDMCISRIKAQINAGHKPEPVCVSSCIQRALDFGTYGELTEKYRSFTNVGRYINGEVNAFPADISPSTGQHTNPCILIRKKNYL